MQIYQLLINDHRKVEDLMDECEECDDEDERQEIFEEVKQELLVHSEAEKQTFYRALEDEEEELIQHAEEEHEEVKDMLRELSKMDINDEEWDDTFAEMKEAVLDHVREEEGEIFRKARRILSPDDAEDLAEEMQQMKQRLNRRQMAA